MENVYLSQRLATDSDKFHLGCLINKDFKTVEKEFVWLEFTELKDKKYPDQNMIWDNPEYLFTTLLEYLEQRVNFRATKEQIEEFEDIHDKLTKDDVFDLLELLNTAKNLNWH